MPGTDKEGKTPDLECDVLQGGTELVLGFEGYLGCKRKCMRPIQDHSPQITFNPTSSANCSMRMAVVL